MVNNTDSEHTTPAREKSRRESGKKARESDGSLNNEQLIIPLPNKSF